MSRHMLACAIAASTLGLAVSAAAAPPSAQPPTRTSAPAQAPLSDLEMAEMSGGQKVNVTALTTQQLTATSTGNTVVAGTLTSGGVSFSPQALAGFNGVGNFVINTGANNALQGAVNISIVTVPNS